MAHESNGVYSQSPTIAYARLLRQVHDLNARDDGDPDEAEALADEMDAPWYAMSDTEQKRMRGLSQDLYALREGGPKRVEMTSEDLRLWQQRANEAHCRLNAGDVDSAFAFARQPIPSHLDAQFVPFFQALCWEKLGDLETALTFLKEAERADPNQALFVLHLLQKLERADEVSEYVERIIANPSSRPLALYLAANALLAPTLRMSRSQATPILHKAVSVLERALVGCSNLSEGEKEEFLDVYASIALSLGSALELLRDLKSAIKIYSEAISKHPSKGELFAARGCALYEDKQPYAWSDLEKAVRLQVANIWPYLLLSRRDFQMGTHGQAHRLALAAVDQPGPAAARAEAYEAVAMGLAELGQPQERVLENFDMALALDPNNDRIRANRDIIVSTMSVQAAEKRFMRTKLTPAPPIKAEWLRQARNEQIFRGTEKFLNGQLHDRLSSLVRAG